MFNKREQSPAYGKLESEDCERLMPSSDSESIENTPTKKPFSPILNRLIQLFCIALAVGFGIWLGRRSQPRLSSNDITLEVSQNSPVLEDIDVTYNVIRFNGSFMHQNIFRQPASPEVDAAWKSLGADYRPLAVPEHLAAKAGLAPDQVKISQKYGGGYPANVEGLHHLHCLNLLRKTSYWDYDYYHALGEGAFSNDDQVLRIHTSHCLDILRQQLMCTTDIGVLGQVWWDSSSPGEPIQPHAFTDFNTQHKCRNFDAIRQWAEEHQLPASTPIDYLEPPKEGDRIYPEIP